MLCIFCIWILYITLPGKAVKDKKGKGEPPQLDATILKSYYLVQRNSNIETLYRISIWSVSSINNWTCIITKAKRILINIVMPTRDISKLFKGHSELPNISQPEINIPRSPSLQCTKAKMILINIATSKRDISKLWNFLKPLKAFKYLSTWDKHSDKFLSGL